MSMSPIAVAQEVIRTTLDQNYVNSYAASRAVLEALIAENLLVTTADLQRRAHGHNAPNDADSDAESLGVSTS